LASRRFLRRNSRSVYQLVLGVLVRGFVDNNVDFSEAAHKAQTHDNNVEGAEQAPKVLDHQERLHWRRSRLLGDGCKYSLLRWPRAENAGLGQRWTLV